MIDTTNVTKIHKNIQTLRQLHVDIFYAGKTNGCGFPLPVYIFNYRCNNLNIF